MKQLLTLVASCCIASAAQAQITITAVDMPVAGDTFHYKLVEPGTASLDLSRNGASVSWDFSDLAPSASFSDTFRAAAETGYTGAPAGSMGLASASALADLDFGGLPVTLSNPYSFYNLRTDPASFNISALAVTLSGIPLTMTYSNEDELFFLPLTFEQADTSDFRMDYTMTPFGSVMTKGERVTQVDAYGTLTTPFYTDPVEVLRVRSEVKRTDSANMSGQPPIGVESHIVDYYWLASGVRAPLVHVMTRVSGESETIIAIRYHAAGQTPPSGISETAQAHEIPDVYPNPVSSGKLRISVPGSWTDYTASLYDIQGGLILTVRNAAEIDANNLTPGNYIIRIQSGSNTGSILFRKD